MGINPNAHLVGVDRSVSLELSGYPEFAEEYVEVSASCNLLDSQGTR